MRELPKEKNRVEKPSRCIELTGHSDVSDQHRHGTGKCAHQRAHRRSTFERSVQKQVTNECQHSKEARSRSHRESQVSTSRKGQQHSENQSMVGFDATSSDRSARCAPHLCVELSLDHLIQCTCPARNQDCPKKCVYKKHPWKPREWFSTADDKSGCRCQGNQEIYFRLR